MFEIEAVSICVGYSDFLAETARLNRQFFQKWVIVTKPDDEETIKVCHQHNLEVILTKDFDRNGRAAHLGEVFNKGRAIQRGFNALSCKHWVLHIDADIALPPEFYHALDMAYLETDKLYGCRRLDVHGWDAWQRIQQSRHRLHGQHCYVMPHPRGEKTADWASPREGYVPIGFFQLTHGSNLCNERSGIWIRPYPEHHAHAARSDVQFGLKWDRRDRVLIPELYVWHLESEESAVGTNWNGRKSKPFGPEAAYASRPSPEPWQPS